MMATPKEAEGNSKDPENPLLGFRNNDYGKKEGETKKSNKKQDKEDSERDLKTWPEAVFDLCQNTTMHGFKQMTEPQPFFIRRLFWFTLVIVGGVIFAYQLTDSIIYYFEWPVTVNVKINYNDTILFPAVTVCNQNSFRLTQAYQHNDYALFEKVFSSSNHENISFEDFEDSDRSLLDLYLMNAHTQQDLIISCMWNGHDCHPDDIVQTVTDFGICYTFNWNQRNTRNARETGVEGGLTLLLNIEQYEYMPGPNSGAGLKLSLHSQHEQAYVRDHGLAVPPGTHAFVALKTVKIENLEKPHGKCDDSIQLQYADEYTVRGCQAECKTRFIKERCDCIDIYMPGKNETEVCTVRQYTDCFLETVEDMHHTIVDEYCPYCPVPCDSLIYQPTISYSALSNYYMMRLLESNTTQALGVHLEHALEVTQRVNEASVRADQNTINNLASTVDFLRTAVIDIRSSLNQSNDLMEFMLSEITMRTKFHFEKALSKVEYVAVHDFIRGFDIRKERYFYYVANNFYEIGDGLKRMILSLNNTFDDVDLKLAAWMPMDNQLAGRDWIIGLARQKVLEADHSYRTGEPMLTYEASIDERYDQSYIFPKLYTQRVNKQDVYVGKLEHAFSGMVTAIKIFRAIGMDFVYNGTFDEELFQQTELDYIKYCKSYNYYIFMFEERVVNHPRDVIEGRIAKFNKANATLHDKFRLWRVAMNNVINVTSSISGINWLHLEMVVHKAQAYLEDKDAKKRSLAADVVSHQTVSSLQQMEVLFKDFRSRALDLNDAWTEIEWAYKNIWQNMLTESTTKPFYEKLREDFVAYLSNENLQAKYIRLFASLLNEKRSELSKQYPNQDLIYLLNADFPTTNISQKLNELTAEFESITNRADVVSHIDDKDFLLNAQFTKLHKQMQDFIAATQIDSKFVTDNFMRLDVFMQELSYEQITQQPAYDVIQLLGDIGGSLGLFLGASVLTIFEILDTFIHRAVRLSCRR